MILDSRKAHSIAVVLAASLAMIAPVQAGASDSDTEFSPFVIGGEPVTDDDDVPSWLANYRLLLADNFLSQPVCAATLVADGWAMTAAHCIFVLRSDNGQLFPIPPSNIYLQFDQADFADDDISYPNESGALGERIVIQPGYSDSRTEFDSDVALIKLAGAGGSNRTPVDLRMQEPVEPEVQSLLGWGFTDPTSDGSDRETILQRLDDHPIVDRATCQADYGESVITDRMICAGQRDAEKDNEGPCFGDSGGPLFEDQHGFSTQSGIIVSFGTRQCGSRPLDGVRIPSVYTNVALFRDWIYDRAAEDGPAAHLNLEITTDTSVTVEACEAFDVRLSFDPDDRRKRIFDPRYFTAVDLDVRSHPVDYTNGVIDLTLTPRSESESFDLTVVVFDHYVNLETIALDVTVSGTRCTGQEGTPDIRADTSSLDNLAPGSPPGQDEEPPAQRSSSSSSGGGGGAVSWPWAMLLLLGLTDWLRRRRVA